MTLVADDKSRGMTMDELATVLATARTAGFTEMGRTRVGFNGRIQDMTFTQPEENTTT